MGGYNTILDDTPYEDGQDHERTLPKMPADPVVFPNDWPSAAGPITPAPSSTPMHNGNVIGSDAYWGDVEKQLRDAATSKGVTYDQSDLEGVKRNASNGYGEGLAGAGAALANQLSIYDTRRGSTNDRTADSQSAAGNALYGSGSGNASNTPGGAYRPAAAPNTSGSFANTSPQFDDPSSRLIEDYALDRFRQRQNPDPTSGTALYEQYAKQLIDTLKGPVYSAGDESIIKGRAFDAIEQERSATKQQWLQELSRRGIQPSSGIALDGMLKIDNHYAGLRTNVESQFSQNAIDQTRQQRNQVLDVYGQLANSEESRLREALTYGSLPYELQNNAFQRNLQLVGAGGSPQSLLNSALQIYGAGQQADAYRSQGQQASLAALMEYLGQRFG